MTDNSNVSGVAAAQGSDAIVLDLAAASNVIAGVLGVGKALLPLLPSTPSLVGTIITAIEAILPLLTNQVPALVNEVKSFLDQIRAGGTATAEQIAKTDALIAQVDTQWDADLAAYQANHPAEGGA